MMIWFLFVLAKASKSVGATLAALRASGKRMKGSDVPIEIFLPPSPLSSKEVFSGGHTGGGGGGGGGSPSPASGRIVIAPQANLSLVDRLLACIGDVGCN